MENTISEKPLFTNKQILNLVWPIILESFLNVLVGMIDVLMVAVLGEQSVSGVSLVDSMNVLVINVLGALTTGGTIICSQFIGKKDHRKASEAAGQLILITVMMTGVVTLILLFGGKGILSVIFGQVEADIMSRARVYCVITSISFPFLALFNSAAAVFRSVGNSKLPMKMALLMNGINVVGNALCIFGLHMDVAGVAIPTLFARALSSVLIFILLQRSSHGIKVLLADILHFNKAIIKKILSIGIPSGLESGMFNFGKLLLSSLVSTLGTASIAGYAVAANLVTFLYLPGNSLGIGLATVSGQCVGAGDIDQAKRYTRFFIKLNYAAVIIVGLPMALGRNFLVGLYNLEPASAIIASFMFLTHAIAMVIWPLAFMKPYFLRTVNKAAFTMKVSVSIMWICRVALAYVFVKVFHGGVETIWYAMYLDWVARTIIYFFAFRKMKFKID